MNTPTYDPSGSYIAAAGIIAAGINYFFNYNVDANVIVTIIAGIVALAGVARQAIAHKNLAVAAGAVK